MKLIRKVIIVVSIVILASISFACISQIKKHNLQHSREKLAEGFITPADSMQTAVYWYWISDNISKDGVVKDL